MNGLSGSQARVSSAPSAGRRHQPTGEPRGLRGLLVREIDVYFVVTHIGRSAAKEVWPGST